MLDSVLDQVTGILTGHGFHAFREFPDSRMHRDKVSVCVGAEGCKSLSSGLGDYLGVRTEDNGAETELFGRRLELTLAFEIFSPFEVTGAAGCTQCADELRRLLLRFPSGFRLLETTCGEVTADEELSSFRCTFRVKCIAFLVAEDLGGQGEFLDFVLKGVVDGVN